MITLNRIMKLILLLTFTAFLSKCSSPSGNPTPVTKPVVSITSAPVTEGTDVVFTITLNNSSVSATIIDIVTTPNTASTADYTTTNVSKTIPAGQTSVTVNIPTNNDAIGELTETFTLTGTVTSSNTANTAPIIAIGTILDNGILQASELDIWLTKGDQSVLLQKQNTTQRFGTTANSFQTIAIDENQTYQTIDGFGYTLTGGSVEVINSLNATKKQELLQELFGNTATSIGISYLRISIGASDLNSTVFSYNDLPNGQVDTAQTNFSLAPDNAVILLLKEILLINPNIKIMAVPWSAPSWMKSNYTTVGSSLAAIYYNSYATYFVKYIQGMKANGITIDAVCPQNEPLNPNNNPSMTMSAEQQLSFIKKLGLAFQNASITTKIVSYDHNCDVSSYPISILSDATAYPFVDGSAFHLYGGDISALSTVHDAFPNKRLYFTEQWTSSTSDFRNDLKWHVKNVVIGSMRNWSVNALEWNVANNPNFGPHTAGGCSQCKGAITINNSSTYTRNVAYYNIAHASKFVPTGSVRIASNISGNLSNVAFKTPSGKKVLIVENDGNTTETFNIKFNGKWIPTSLESGSVGTYIW
jgi:glucosylceramidase